MELYISLAFLSALMSALLAFQIYRLDLRKQFTSFIPVMFSTGMWALFSGIWLLVPSGYVVAAVKGSYIGIITLPVFFFLFALDFASSSWLPRIRKKRWVLWLIPVLSLLVMATNSLHGLFWKDVHFDQTYAGADLYGFVPGPWFIVHAIYSYSLVFATAVILFVAVRRHKPIISHYALLAGILAPAFASILYLAGVTMLDYSPLVLTLAIVIVAMAISHRFYLENITKTRVLQEKTSELNKLYHNVVRVSERLIQAEPEQIDAAIDEVLGTLGVATRVDRSYVFLYDTEHDEVSNTHEWCRAGIPSEKENLQHIPFKEAVPRWRQVLMNGDHIYIPLVKDLPDNEIYVDERAILEPQGIQSLVVVPLFSGKQFAGFAGFDSVHQTRAWDEESIALLKLAAGIIAGSLDRVGYEKALIRARDEAEEANRVKTEFLANMSHELQTPLNAIMGFTEAVADDLPEGENREQLGIALRSSEALLQLINDLLDFSKAEAGVLSVNPIETDLGRLLHFVRDTFLPGAMEKKLDLQVELAPEARKSFVLDEPRLRQVLFNLVGNAVKFTHKGCVKITAQAEVLPEKAAGRSGGASGKPDAGMGHDASGEEAADSATGATESAGLAVETGEGPTGADRAADSVHAAGEEAAGGFVPHRLIITVEDTGIGIRKEDQGAIFKEFVQLSSGDNRQYDGTGLGLNIAQRLVYLMNGDIRVQSQPGKGSRFVVALNKVPGQIKPPLSD